MPLPIPGGGGGPPIPPIPCTGAAPKPTGGSPTGGPPGGGAPRVPRPAPDARPGPPGANLPVIDGGGGPSTAKLTTFSPLIRTNPRFRFSVRSSSNAAPPLLLSVRNSSASLRTKLRCLSKAKKVPTIERPSWSVTRRRCSTYLNSLLPFPLGYVFRETTGTSKTLEASRDIAGSSQKK
jgi:hypothetical protein